MAAITGRTKLKDYKKEVTPAKEDRLPLNLPVSQVLLMKMIQNQNVTVCMYAQDQAKALKIDLESLEATIYTCF